MAADVPDQAVEETQPANVFAFHLEGGMETSNTIQLVLFFVRRSSSCGTFFLFCRSPKGHTTVKGYVLRNK
jgi:hypothetical protein